MRFLLAFSFFAGRSRGQGLRVRVFFHDKCFDGTASAALFARFYRERIRADADFTYTGLVHRAGARPCYRASLFAGAAGVA